MRNLAADMLDLIERYEKIPRAALAMNLQYAMKELELTKRGECIWLANLLKTTRNTTYSWLAPNRESKAPLKAVLTISVRLDVSLDALLDSSMRITSEQLRISKERPNFKESVLQCVELHPEWSIQQIADELKVGSHTVRRHLNMSKENSCVQPGGKNE